jgi:hypothetical protein
MPSPHQIQDPMLKDDYCWEFLRHPREISTKGISIKSRSPRNPSQWRRCQDRIIKKKPQKKKKKTKKKEPSPYGITHKVKASLDRGLMRKK